MIGVNVNASDAKIYMKKMTKASDLKPIRYYIFLMLSVILLKSGQLEEFFFVNLFQSC